VDISQIVSAILLTSAIVFGVLKSLSPRESKPRSRASDQTEFERTKNLLRSALIGVGSAEHRPDVYGSWYIELAGDPALRIVWDGKDAWLMLQRKTSELFLGAPVWENVVTLREVLDGGPESVVNRAVEIRREARRK
jgi:hypothetical protein